MDLEVGNSMGDVALIKLPVHVLGEKRDKVRIELTENLVYVQKDETFDPHIFVAGVFDEQENPIDAEMARAECSADFTIPGIYEVHYVADDGLGNTGETWLVVVVEE